MERAARIQVALWFLLCASVAWGQDVPRADVQELLNIHARERIAMQGQIEALEAQVLTYQQAVQVLTLANEKQQQALGVKQGKWTIIGQWALRLAPVVFSMTAAVK